MSKHILITGGSKGIGAAVCTALADRDDKVVNLSRTFQEAITVSNVHQFKCDLQYVSGHPNGIEMVVEKVKDYGYRFDAVVMNAGIARRTTWLNETAENLLQNFKVNALGHYKLLQELYSNDMLRSHCNVVNVISKASFEGNPEQPAYCASKAAQYSLFSSAARELIHKGIQINHLIPGPVETEMNPIKTDQTGLIDPHKKPESVVPAFLYLIDQPPGGMNDRVLDLRRR